MNRKSNEPIYPMHAYIAHEMVGLYDNCENIDEYLEKCEILRDNFLYKPMKKDRESLRKRTIIKQNGEIKALKWKVEK